MAKIVYERPHASVHQFKVFKHTSKFHESVNTYPLTDIALCLAKAKADYFNRRIGK